MGACPLIPPWRSSKLVLRFLCGMLAIMLCPVAPIASGNCGGYVMLTHHGDFASADFVGHPFGRSLARDQLSAHLAARAVHVLETEREARQAREAGYRWTPSQPDLPCQGPACGGHARPTSPNPAPAHDYSSGELFIYLTRVMDGWEVLQGDALSLTDVTIPVGDWPSLVRPPDDSY